MYATDQGPIRDLTSLLSVFLSINFYSNYVKKISYMRTNSIGWVSCDLSIRVQVLNFTSVLIFSLIYFRI